MAESSPVTFVLDSRYRNFPEETFYGIGAGSSLGDLADYQLEESLVRFGVDLNHSSGLKGRALSGYRRNRAGPGHSRITPSLQEVFPSGFPGFSGCVDYWINEFELGYDHRDSPGNPRSGIAVRLDQGVYIDRNDRFGFQRTEAEFQGYLPVLHKHRVLAFRMSGRNTDAASGEDVPFYDLPTLGGHDTLRGYHEYRFRDRKSLLFNLEYRFEAFIGLDVALFGDAGQVGGRWSDFRLTDFRTSYGGGFRFNTARSVFLRIDIGHGAEGTRFFFKFGNVF